MKITTNLKMLLPEGKDPVNIDDLTGNFETLDTYLADVQKATSDASKMPVIFSQAADRQNIASTEMLSTIMGKIAKFFSDIKAAAFCAIANNDSTTADGYVADARIVKTHGDEIDALKTSTNNSVSSLEKAISENKSSISSLNSNLANFQHGVDALYNQIVSLGVTPSGKTLDAVKNSISTVSNNSYNTGFANGKTEGYNNGYSAGQTAGYNSGYSAGKADGTVTSVQGVGSANQTISTTAGELYICTGLGNNVNGNIEWGISGATSLWGTGGNSGGQQYRVNLVKATGTSMYVTCGNHVHSSVVRLVRG